MDKAKVIRIIGFSAFIALIIYAVIALWPIIMPFFLAIILAAKPLSGDCILATGD